VRSASSNLAQQLIRHAIAQPVVTSPRLLSVIFAALAKFGVVRGSIWSLGNKP